MKKALSFGILSSMFFAVTFVLNRSMNLTGGFWMWGACLRYLIMLPLLFVILLPKKRFLPVIAAVKAQPDKWFIWSTVGFGLFYLPLSLAAVFGESWLVAASWQITIVCGVLLTPLFGGKIPRKNLGCAVIILVGITIMQLPNFRNNDVAGNCLALIPILIAAICYPLGNRKMMQYCPDELDTLQRVFGMTLCSVPFWVIVAVVALCVNGAPSAGQVLKSSTVALFSGVIATGLFFTATNLVKKNPKQLALVEATQCGEVIFTLLGGVLILGDAVPGISSAIGIVLVVGGMILNSLAAAKG